MRSLLILACAALAACGADGEPVPPEPREAQTGPGIRMEISGEASMGIAAR